MHRADCADPAVSGLAARRRPRFAVTLAATTILACLPLPATAAINIGDSCAGFFPCSQTCAEGDQACVDECTPTTTAEIGEIQAVLACLEANCPTDEGQELQDCLDENCRAELDKCFEDATGTQEPCPEGLAFTGRCNGDTLEWCQQSELHRLDCAKRGGVCSFVEEVQSFDCVEAVVRDEAADPHLLGLRGLAACSAAGASGATSLLGAALALLALRRRPRAGRPRVARPRVDR